MFLKFLKDGDNIKRSCTVLTIAIYVEKYGQESLINGDDLKKEIMENKNTQDEHYSKLQDRFKNA